MTCPPAELLKKSDAVRAYWQAYRATPRFEQFVEFAIALSSHAEFLHAKGLPGLQQLAHSLEQQALSLFGDGDSHPIAATALADLDQRIQSLTARIHSYIDQHSGPARERRSSNQPQPAELLPARRIWLCAEQPQHWQDLVAQLGYFGIAVELHDWQSLADGADEPGLILVDTSGLTLDHWAERLRGLRARFMASKLVGLGVPPDFASLQTALASGCDFCFPAATAQAAVMAKILELSGSEEEAPYRVLVVEDSLTATRLIQRTLNESGIGSLAIAHPRDVLTTLQRYQPDLILMDMYMPGCTGVEAARVIRQHAEFLSIPIVYLSGETDVAMQIDALRLGGDHFLTKPFNPVILNAIVKSKIERYRALRRSMFHDSLTGLLNHTSSKQRLNSAVATAASEQQPLAVAMVDIDHFKKVNDSYGHPVGDQIIRSLAWLLKQRLRRGDIVGRYGGEEFVIGLPGSNSQQALQVLDRIRRDFGQIRHPFGDSWFNATFSCGIASFPHVASGESLVKEADDALYEAKRAGRNCVIAHD